MGRQKDECKIDLIKPQWYILWCIEGVKAIPLIEWSLREEGQTDYKFWVPLQKIEKNPDKIKFIPIYPTYIFIYCIYSFQVESRIKYYYGGEFLRTDRNNIYIMSEEDLELIKRVEESNRTEPDDMINFKAGDRVRILSNPFKDYEGVVDRIERRYVYIKIYLLGRIVNIPFPSEALEKV